MSMPRGKTPTISKTDVTDITSGLGVFGPAGYTASEAGPPSGLPAARPGRVRGEGVRGRASDRRGSRRSWTEWSASSATTARTTPSDRGILNAGTNLGTIHHKVVENELAPMPPSVTDGLSGVEREKLFECLRAEYAEILKEWLTSDLLMVP